MSVDPDGPTILGRPLHAPDLPEPALRWLNRHWLNPTHTVSRTGFIIRLTWVDEAPPPLANAERATARLHGASVEWQRAGDEWAWRQSSRGVQFVLSEDSADIHAWGAPAGPEIFTALHVAFTEALRASGLLLLHAAVAVPPAAAADLCTPERSGDVKDELRAPARSDDAQDEQYAHARDVDASAGALAFLGRSGAGKSTTLLRLSRDGWTPLCEDLAWLDPDSGMVYGFDRGIRLWPGTAVEFVPELAGLPWTADDDGKLLLSYAALSEALGRATQPRSARLDGIALIGRTQDAESVWEEALPVEMVAALWESMGIPLVPESRAAASRWIAAAVARLASYRLRAGTGTIACPPPVV